MDRRSAFSSDTKCLRNNVIGCCLIFFNLAFQVVKPDFMYVQPEEEEGELPFFKYLKIVAGICCLFSALLLVDFILPVKCMQEIIQKRLYVKENNRFGANDYQLHVVTPSFKIKVAPPLYEDATEKSPVKICYSPLLKITRNVSGS